ncbi:MAG TPA: T9SS type B sorting domain-containing protein [Crocinitomix sp.]|nr:T9SS type B sorting domain-containing protein [Crocinitomix sp.]
MLKKILLIFLVVPFISKGQIVLDGTTSNLSCGCYALTNNNTNQVGGIHNGTTIDLNNPFDFYFTVNFGCDNNGGEGMAFVLQTGPWTLGNSGAGIGYEGINNSIAIEFDTRDNQASNENLFGDNGVDHITIQANGSLDHLSSNNLLGVGTLYNINPSYSNVEDCNDHLVEIIWNPSMQTFDVLLDGVSSFGGPQNVGDIITNQFGGNPIVTWGWTGSTGVLPATPNQTVCMALEPTMTYTVTSASCTSPTVDFFGSEISFYNIVSYNWDFDNGAGSSSLQNPSFTFATGGNHQVDLTITDINSCTSTQTFEIGIGFNLNVTADDNTICPNSSTILHANASPFSSNTCCYTLKLTNLWKSGWYDNYVEVFENGISIGTFTMYPQITTNITETYDLCFNQNSTVDVVVHGPLNGAGGNDPVLFPGECAYELVDASNNVVASAAAGASTFYEGATSTFTVNCGIVFPNYTYSWDNASLLDNSTIESPTATVPNTTTFTVQVTDPNTGCTIPESITITTSPPASATISGNITVCQGNTDALTINFTGTPPYDVVVNEPGGGTQTFTGITSTPFTFQAGLNGNYTLNSMTGDGCSGTVSGTATVNVIIPPTVTIASSQSVCDGDVITPLTVTSSNGGTVNWYNDAGLTNLVGTGNTYNPPSIIGTTIYYAQEIEGVLGCAGPVDNVVITVNPIPPAPLVTGQTTYCENDTPSSLTAEMSLNGTATWYNNSSLTPPNISTLLQYTPTLNLGTTCYYVVETANGCTGPYTEICVTTNPTPTAPLITGNLTYCEGDTPSNLTATPTMGGTIDWFNSSGTLANNITTFTPDISLGNQTISATETLNGCTSPISSVDVTVNILPTVDVPDSVNICRNDSILVTASNNGFSLLWENGDTTESSWLSTNNTTYFTIIANNPLCGIATDSVKVIVLDLPSVIAGNDTVIGIGGEVELWSSATGYGALTYQWSPEPNECITDNCSDVYVVPTETTTYIVTIIDANQCQNSDTVLVSISGYQEVFVPNIFSPNGDGQNDYLEIKGPRLFNYNIKIYDRWGKLIFESVDQKDYWDGTFKGNPLAEQTFVYTLVGETVVGEKINISGNVTIIK